MTFSGPFQLTRFRDSLILCNKMAHHGLRMILFSIMQTSLISPLEKMEKHHWVVAAWAVSCIDASFLWDDTGYVLHITWLKLGMFASTSKLSTTVWWNRGVLFWRGPLAPIRMEFAPRYCRVSDSNLKWDTEASSTRPFRHLWNPNKASLVWKDKWGKQCTCSGLQRRERICRDFVIWSTTDLSF